MDSKPFNKPLAIQVRILFVEDSAACRALNKRIAEHAGFRVDTASDGLECCKIVEANPSGYDLIVMDIVMPVMDGIDAAERLRRHGVSIPIVPLSGLATEDVQQRCMTVGMNGFVQKPLTVPKLKAVLTDNRLM
eukprot:TRINITY_DN4700_c0_g1_i1.p1 TRINITY_DN4700_c0_g1~~TRINITY_DN4700_c0_g1_i1.p1  ORF type:complete len:134 (-),score=1.98 TRINITY_DN4700_c0_g1_i1:93-494(-)